MKTMTSIKVGQNFEINPPTDYCNICGKQVTDLESFDAKMVKKFNDDISEIVKELSLEFNAEYPPGLFRSFSPDSKLYKMFRPVFWESSDGEEGFLVEASWECKDCFRLSDEEAIRIKIESYKNNRNLS